MCQKNVNVWRQYRRLFSAREYCGGAEGEVVRIDPYDACEVH